MRRGEIDKAHAFFLRRLDLFVDGGHVFAFAAIEDGGLRPHAQHGARGIDGCIAAAHDGDAGTDRGFFAAGDGLKKNESGKNVLQLGAGQIEPGLLPGSDGDEDGVVFGGEFVERKPATAILRPVGGRRRSRSRWSMASKWSDWKMESAMRRCTSRMFTTSSKDWRRHLLSQGCWQTRPVDAGSGLSRMTDSNASSTRPS